MAATFLAKKATTKLPKAQPYVDSATRISRVCVTTTTAYERFEKGSSSVAETRGEGTGPDRSTNNDPVSQGMCEAEQQGLDIDERLRTGIADSAKEGLRKATEVDERVSNGGNGIYIDHHKDDNHTEDNVLDEIHNIDGPVDTIEYRVIEENIEDLKKTGNIAELSVMPVIMGCQK